MAFNALTNAQFSADPTFSNPKFGVSKNNSQLDATNAASSGRGAVSPPKSPRGLTKTQSKILRYPQAKLTSLDDYVEIKVIRYQRKKIETGVQNFNITDATTQIRTTKAKSILATILLPMPKEVPQDTNQVTWGGSTLNPLEVYGADALQSLISSGNLPQAIIAQIQDAMATAKAGVIGGNVQNAVQSAIVAQLLNSFGSNVNAQTILSRSTGQILNPNMELLFQNVNLRAFPFTFDLAPRDANESKVIKDIIRTFKQTMSAKTGATNQPGSGFFISAPDIFEISYKSGGTDHPFLNRFKPCALTNMTVNYAASGSYATYPDATPVHMVMQLTFSELNPIYYEDYDEGIGRDGVGY